MIVFNMASTQPDIHSGKRHGGGIYGEIVFKQLLRKTKQVIALYDDKKWINPEIVEVCRDNGVTVLSNRGMTFEKLMKDYGCRLFYSPVPNCFLADFETTLCSIIMTIHGLRDFELPLDWYELLYKKSLRQMAKFWKKVLIDRWNMHSAKLQQAQMLTRDNLKFVTISNHSKYSFGAVFPMIDYEKIQVFASPSTVTWTMCDRELDAEKEPFFLLVSGNRWEKNNLRAIMALDELMSEGKLNGYRVVVTGVQENGYYYRIKNKELFEFHGYVDDQELNELYKRAYCFVYPTLNEGFGYPPLEAMHAGTPVLASAFSSVSEVCADAVIYFNPFSILEIQNRLLMILNEKVYHEYQHRGYRQFDVIKRKQDEDLDLLIEYIIKEAGV